MNTTQKSSYAFVVAWVVILLCSAAPGFAQVSPAETLDPRLKAIEQAYLTRLMTLNGAVVKVKFPFILSLSRYAGLDPKDQLGTDARGLEFVNFHQRFLLKLTANYNAAFNAALLTPNQRATRVFGEVVVPILGLLPSYFSPSDGFDAFGFEIAYHVRRKTHDYEYEGKEILLVILDKADALSYFNTQPDSKRQEVLNRSDVYLDGKPFGLALDAHDPLTVEALERSFRKQTAPVSNPKTVSIATHNDEPTMRTIENRIPLFRASSIDLTHSPARSEAPVARAAPTQAEAETLQGKYQPQLDALGKEGAAKLHFVDYAPPSFVVFQDHVFLQLTLRNPQSFDKDATSIYKRAAQSFDLFLAPQLKSILEKVPDGADFGGLDITILNDFTLKPAHSSEAVEFICPIKPLRRFAAAEITNQDLINQSVVLVNGVRIAISLQLVE